MPGHNANYSNATIFGSWHFCYWDFGCILALVFCTEVLDKRESWEEGNIVNHALPIHAKESLRKSTAILRLCLLCPQECLE